ncbi:hypothetical protein DPMN_182284 [Dreissena polymorpha]|uniref:Uncharacterized protein n=1 Tax=Dreissena polymorpha TaxID=45954 RepID=A0A9D4I608_DREPO|nr:hypothetical protein DPMN_182284 [Dreissena polymorpha]
MESRAEEAIKEISTASSNKAAIDAYEKETELEDLVNVFSRQPATPTVLLMMLKHWDLCLKHTTYFHAGSEDARAHLNRYLSPVHSGSVDMTSVHSGSVDMTYPT